MVNFHTNTEMVVLLFLYIYCLYYIIRKIIIFNVFFNFKKAADTDLVIVHWRQSKCGKSMHHEKISQTHININTLHLQIKQKSFLQVINDHLVIYMGL